MRILNGVDLNNSPAKNVAAPVDATDAATKRYVDDAISNVVVEGGGGTVLTSYTQVQDLDGYPASFPTTTGSIADAGPAGRSLLQAATQADMRTALGLGQVNNTSDLDKPISNQVQAALNLKANATNPTFSGTVTGLTKNAVGLGNVDNTSDADKPVSTATQTALDQKLDFVPGVCVAVFRAGGDWPANRPTNSPDVTVLCIGQTPGPAWMQSNDVLLDLSHLNNDIYLLPSDTLVPSDDLLVKG